MVKNPPSTYAELEKWVAANPKKFGYNGIKGGMSGVAFVVGWIYSMAPNPDQLMKGPYDARRQRKAGAGAGDAGGVQQERRADPGNAGTLDMLNRGEIAMGPVWVDMFYHLAGRRQDPADRQIEADRPGDAGPADVLRCARQGGERQAGRRVCRTGDKPQGGRPTASSSASTGIPGIDAGAVKAQLDDATWAKLFVDVTPEDLAQKGKPFPIAPYSTTSWRATSARCSDLSLSPRAGRGPG